MELASLLTLPQIVGYCAMAIGLSAPQFKQRAWILGISTLVQIIWATHYWLMDAPVGFWIAMLASVRLAIFTFKRERNWASNTVWLWLFSLASIGVTIWQFQGWHSLLILAGDLIFIFATWLNNPARIRLLCFCGSTLLLLYGLSIGSWAIVFNDVFALCSVLIAAMRLDKEFYKNTFAKFKNTP